MNRSFQKLAYYCEKCDIFFHHSNFEKVYTINNKVYTFLDGSQELEKAQNGIHSEKEGSPGLDSNQRSLSYQDSALPN